MSEFPQDANAKAAILSGIKLLSLDVDGVLTDGGIYYADDGNSFRKFNSKDGMGIVHLQRTGFDIAVISAGAPGAIEHRARWLNIAHVFTNVDDKLETLRELAAKLGLDLSQVAHMGDDINDLPLMKVVGCPIAVADAMPEVIECASIVTEKDGGRGAVREICDIIRRIRLASADDV